MLNDACQLRCNEWPRCWWHWQGEKLSTRQPHLQGRSANPVLLQWAHCSLLLISPAHYERAVRWRQCVYRVFSLLNSLPKDSLTLCGAFALHFYLTIIFRTALTYFFWANDGSSNWTDYTNRYPNFSVHLNNLGACHTYREAFLHHIWNCCSPQKNSIITFGLLVPNPIIKNCLTSDKHKPSLGHFFKAKKQSIGGKMKLACQASDFIFLSKKPHTDSLETMPRKIAHVYWSSHHSKLLLIHLILRTQWDRQHDEPIRQTMIPRHRAVKWVFKVWSSHELWGFEFQSQKQ